MRIVLLAVVLLISTAAHAGGPDTAPTAIPEDAQIANFYQQLNELNPLAQHSPGAAPALGASQAQLESVQKLLGNKWVQKYLHVLSDQDLQKDMLGLINSPVRNSFLLWELGFVVFMMIFKAWRMMKAKGLFSILFTQLWTLAVFAAGVSYVIPRLLYGPAYSQFIQDLIRAIHG